METILLILGNRRDLVLAHLLALSRRPVLPHLLVLLPVDEADYDPAWRQEITLQYRDFCLQAGHYAQQLSCPLHIWEVHLDKLPGELASLPGFHRLLVTPEEVADTGESLEVSFSPVQAALVDRLGGEPDEELLRESLAQLEEVQGHQAFTLEEALQRARSCALQWLDFPAPSWEIAWEGIPGALWRCLQDMQLWRYGLMQADRDLIDQAIRAILADPANWPAHLALMLYKRIYRPLAQARDTVPARLQQVVQGLLVSQGKFLEILPPVTDFKISVLIPTYNRVHLLKQAVQSVLNQTSANWQLLIGDDGSTDGTQAYCADLVQRDSRIQYLRSEVNQGFYANVSQLYAAADTELLVGLADDDLILSRHLEKTGAFFHKHPWIALAGGGYFYLSLNQGSQELAAKQIGPFCQEDGIADTQRELQRCGFVNPFFGSGCLLRKSVLAEIAPFEPSLPPPAYAGWDYLISEKCLAGFEVGVIASLLAAYIDRDKATQLSYYMAWDHSLLTLAVYLCQDYAALFGENSFPQDALQYFLDKTAAPYMLAAFHTALYQTHQVQEWDRFIERNLATWRELVAVRQDFLETSRLDAVQRVSLAEAFGPVDEQIVPAYQQGTAPESFKECLDLLLPDVLG